MVRRGTVPGDVRPALAGGLLRGRDPPGSREDEIGRRGETSQQVHRYHRELQARAPLKKHHFVVGADAQQAPELLERLLEDPIEGRAAVADLEHGDADAGQGEQIPLRLFEHLQRQHGRTG